MMFAFLYLPEINSVNEPIFIDCFGLRSSEWFALNFIQINLIRISKEVQNIQIVSKISLQTS